MSRGISIVSYMRKLGEDFGLHSFVKFDPERKSKNFTVFVGDQRVADTDFPERIIKYEYIKRDTQKD
jgi:hypothetical protein